ncbi:MAG: DUF1217 domain-containing protein [Alphaproteobacteria bacterium]
MVSSLSLSIVSTLFPSSSSTGGIDISSLYSSGSSATSSLPPSVALKVAETNEDKQLADVNKEPEVQRDLARYAKVLASAKTLDDVLDDPVARKVFLKANGLGDQVDFVGLAKKALASDPADPDSLANKLSSTNANWLATVKRFDLANSGIDQLRPNNSGFTGDWNVTVNRNGAPVQTNLVITNSTKTGYQATINGVSAPVQVSGDTVTINFAYRDSAATIHTTKLTGKVGKDGSLSGAQFDDSNAVGKWSAAPASAGAIKQVSDDYVSEIRLDNLDEQTPGLGSAILFKQIAPTLKTPIAILGSALGREIVVTALGLPKEIALQSLEAQSAAITKRLDVSKLQDPEFVDKLAQRYLLQLNGGTGGITA